MPKILHDFYNYPFLKLHEDGKYERLMGTETVPASLEGPVLSKDVVFCPELNLSSRLYIPKSIPTGQKLPVLVYFHGGGFVIETPFSPTYHNYLNKLVAEANIVVVSVDYRRAPENPVPAAYNDCWTALKWVASHCNGDGPEEWLNRYGDFTRVFLAGDSAGGNIAHVIGMRFGSEKLDGINIEGIVLIHPCFGGKDVIGEEFKNLGLKLHIDSYWLFTHPNVTGLDDPMINPGCDPNLSRLGCKRVLIMVAEKDFIKSRNWYYYETLKKSGWPGSVEIMEAKGEPHVFHILEPTCHNENSTAMLKKISAFLNQ